MNKNVNLGRLEDSSEVGGSGAQFSLCQVEHLADLLNNRVNCQQDPSLYEVWRQKVTEDIEKQMVRRVCWDGKVPGI